MNNREFWLASTLVELADVLGTDTDETTYFENVAAHLAVLLAPAEVALLFADDAGELTLSVATSPRVGELAALEERNAEGPCRSCFGGRPVSAEALGTAADQWPRFAPAALDAGFRSVTTLPMRHQSETFGAVAVLSTGEQPLPEPEQRLARSLIDAATIGVRQRRALQSSSRIAEQLRHALDSRILIEQAKGVAAAKLDLTPDAAFDLLRGHARRNGRKLVDVADDVIAGRLAVFDLATVAAGASTGRSPSRRNSSGRRGGGSTVVSEGNDQG